MGGILKGTCMELNWSEHSAHIRTLYHPWQSGDGYEEQVIVHAEARLGVRLPVPLRIFYQAYGQRKDMTQFNQSLLEPCGLVGRPDALIFCVENQATYYWAIQCEDLEEDDLPVVVAQALPEWECWEVDAPLHWMPSHAHVSDFLDTLTYHHALCGGAMHGAWTACFHYQESQKAWLEQYWHRTTVGPMVFGLIDGVYNDLPFYVRNGQALAWVYGCSVAACSVEDIDEIGHALQVTWSCRW